MGLKLRNTGGGKMLSEVGYVELKADNGVGRGF
jgi:hypothetical protein